MQVDTFYHHVYILSVIKRVIIIWLHLIFVLTFSLLLVLYILFRSVCTNSSMSLWNLLLLTIFNMMLQSNKLALS